MDFKTMADIDKPPPYRSGVVENPAVRVFFKVQRLRMVNGDTHSIIESFGIVEFLLLLSCALAIAILDSWVRMPF
jgi:hypothetical protein